jgi:hypothetical protein
MPIQTITIEQNAITIVKAPALPLAPTEYQQKYADDLNNILRLYFNKIDSAIGQLRVAGVYSVARLLALSSVNAGARAFVNDSSVTTFNTIVVGGGSSGVPVFFDGTNWRVG